MNINFEQIDGKYIAEFKPETTGILFFNQKKGGDMFVYAYIDDVDPILIYKNTKHIKNNAFKLEVTGVNVKIVSHTEVESCVFTGSGRAINGGGGGILSLLLPFGEASGGMDESIVNAIVDNSFKYGDEVPEGYMNLIQLLTQEEYDKIGPLSLQYGGETIEFTKDSGEFSFLFQQIDGFQEYESDEDMIATFELLGLSLDDLREYKYMFMNGLLNPQDESMFTNVPLLTFEYDGNEVSYAASFIGG